MKKLVLILMSLLMIASLAIPAMAADEGMTFTAEQTHPTQKLLAKGPQTYEAVIRLPKDYTARAGLILSSYKSNGNTAISLQINSGKVLELYYEIDAEKAASVRHKFTEIPVTLIATGEKMDYAGVEVQALSDGYYRVTINIAEVTVASGTPSVLSTFYIRGSGTNASGYIDNLQVA